MQVLTIINGNGKKYSAWESEKLRRILPGNFEVTTSLGRLEDVLHSTRSDNIDIVASSCGDGGAEAVRTRVEKIWRRKPSYVLLRGGTMENLHEAVGLKKSVLDIPKRALQWGETTSIKLARNISEAVRDGLESRHIRKIPIIDVNGRKCTNFSVGIVPGLVSLYEGNSVERQLELEEMLGRIDESEISEFIEEFYTDNSKPGRLNALQACAKAFVSSFRRESIEYDFFSAPISADIYLDGQRLPDGARGIYVASYDKVNIGITKANILPGSCHEPGKLKTIITWEEPSNIARRFPWIIRGEPISNSMYQHFEEMKIRSGDVIRCNIDGDPFYSRDITIRYNGERDIIVGNQPAP